MSALVDVQENIRRELQQLSSQLRKRIFGANNERLDLVVDSFYKLEPPQRNAVIAGGITILSLIVVGFVAFYFAQVGQLGRDLNKRFEAIYELKQLKQEYQSENGKVSKIVDSVMGTAGSLKVKPFFEKIANEQGVQFDGGLTESKSPLPADNPLSEKLQEVKVELRLNNISIPRLLNFLVEIEKGSGSIRVQDLKITGRYGTKMFFDVQIKARGIVPL